MFSCKTERKTFPGRATWTKPLKSRDEKAQNKYKAAGCSPQCVYAVCLASLSSCSLERQSPSQLFDPHVLRSTALLYKKLKKGRKLRRLFLVGTWAGFMRKQELNQSIQTTSVETAGLPVDFQLCCLRGLSGFKCPFVATSNRCKLFLMYQGWHYVGNKGVCIKSKPYKAFCYKFTLVFSTLVCS